MKITPFHLLVAMLGDWLNGEQQKAIDCLSKENKILRELLSGKRIRFSEDLQGMLAMMPRVASRHTCAPRNGPCLDQEFCSSTPQR